MNSTKDCFYLILIVIFGLVSLYFMYCSIKGNYLLNKLSNLLINGKINAFDKLINDKRVSKYIKPFNLDYIRLNRHLSFGKEEEIIESFAKFENVNMNKKQKLSLYQRGYYYYLANNDMRNAKKYYQFLSELDEYAGKTKVEITHDTYINKGSKYLDTVIELAKSVKGSAKIEYYALLADIYENMGQEDKAVEYRQIVENHIK